LARLLFLARKQLVEIGEPLHTGSIDGAFPSFRTEICCARTPRPTRSWLAVNETAEARKIASHCCARAPS